MSILLVEYVDLEEDVFVMNHTFLVYKQTHC